MRQERKTICLIKIMDAHRFVLERANCRMLSKGCSGLSSSFSSFSKSSHIILWHSCHDGPAPILRLCAFTYMLFDICEFFESPAGRGIDFSVHPLRALFGAHHSFDTHWYHPLTMASSLLRTFPPTCHSPLVTRGTRVAIWQRTLGSRHPVTVLFRQALSVHLSRPIADPVRAS